MATIRDVTISTDSGTDRCIALKSEQIARTLSIGSNWNNIRLGILFYISSSTSPTDTITNPLFGFGLTAGTASLAGDATTNHFVGYYSTSSLIGGNNQLWYQTHEVVRITVKTGSGFIQYGNSQDGIWYGRDSNTVFQAVSLLFFIDYVKSAGDPGNWNMKFWYAHTSDGNTTFPTITSIANFYTHISPLTSSVTAINFYTSSQISVPVSQSANGFLDTVNIYWSDVAHPLEIMEVAAYRFS